MSFSIDRFISDLFSSKLTNFDERALQLYRFQLAGNTVMQEYDKKTALPLSGRYLSEIVFLPVEFFKTRDVINGKPEEGTIFTSSSTSGQFPSRHHVKDLSIYRQSFRTAFTHFYGNIEDYCFLALLPSYLERSGSSLVYMATDLIEASHHPMSGFYLNDFGKLDQTLKQLQESKQKTILLGVTYALLDFAEQYPRAFSQLVVMETGGMKGRKQEMVREEVHTLIKQGFGVPEVHSEYGMTELLSQAYATANGHFVCPPWMRVVITDATDPFTVLNDGTAGVINIIDLANIHSCAFIQTSDIGRIFADNSFEVLGRLDNSDIRGCGLMYR